MNFKQGEPVEHVDEENCENVKLKFGAFVDFQQNMHTNFSMRVVRIVT